jgi:hypothetical protein
MRSRSQYFSLLLPAAVGIALGFAEVNLLGFMAARRLARRSWLNRCAKWDPSRK